MIRFFVNILIPTGSHRFGVVFPQDDAASKPKRPVEIDDLVENINLPIKRRPQDHSPPFGVQPASEGNDVVKIF